MLLVQYTSDILYIILYFYVKCLNNSSFLLRIYIARFLKFFHKELKLKKCSWLKQTWVPKIKVDKLEMLKVDSRWEFWGLF